MMKKLRRFIDEFLGDAPHGMFIGETKLHGMGDITDEPSLQPDKRILEIEKKQADRFPYLVARLDKLDSAVAQQKRDMEAIKHGLNSLAMETDILLKKFDK